MNRAPQKKDAKAIFSAAVEYYLPDQWEGYLVNACGDDEALRQRVRELLDAHRQSDSFLDAAQVTEGEPIAERAGSQIGPYKLLQEIGEGGFGVVYMAEQQEPVRRKVALKIIKPGMDTKQVIARFEAERQALAMMDHPNIAKVLGAGATESGRPYFVMELVKGVPVTAVTRIWNSRTGEPLGPWIEHRRLALGTIVRDPLRRAPVISRDGLRLAGIELGSGSDLIRFYDTRKLLNLTTTL